MWKRIKRMISQFGDYDAAIPSTRRKNVGSRIRTADELLTPEKRNRLIESTRDLYRNYSILSWMVRKHLDYVSNFSFQASTQDEVFNERLEELVEWWSRPINFDIAARHSRTRFLRLLEARRVMDGDVFTIKMAGGHLQAIEADRVRDPDKPNNNDEKWVRGIKVGKGGKLQAIAVHQRSSNGVYTFEREVAATNAIQLGYFEGFDQYRGASPLSSAIDSFRDIMEMSDLARAKAKVHGLFALAITKEMSDLLEDEEDEDEAGYAVDLGKGPLKLELDPGDKAEFLESKHPSTEFQQFMDVTLQAALKALDIPTSMYREDFSTYYGARSSLVHYITSVKQKRQDLVDFLNRILVWRISMWISRGILELPAGYTLGDIKWDWIPNAIPWFAPDKELAGDILCIENKLRTRSDIVRERFGQDWKQVIRRLKAEEDFMKAYNIDPQTPSMPVDSQDTVPDYEDEAEEVE